MNAEEQKDYIDLIEVCKKIWANRKLFYIVWPITFVVACIVILPIPRTYESDTIVSPETTGTSSLGSLGSLASSFGLNIGNMQTTDALFPDLYPDIITTNDFIVDLFSVPVTTEDGEISTDYYTYMKVHQKTAYYKYPIKWLHMLKKLLTPSKGGGNGKIDPHHLSRETNDLVDQIRDNIHCGIDKKTGVITIKVEAQDPIVCTTMADTISVRLQNLITDYRTRKARVDADYYHQLMQTAEQEYLLADANYNRFCDANWNSASQTVISEQERLANERSLAQNTYNAIVGQYQLATAKVQERTPVYTVLKAPYVPVRANKPKRVIFVLFMLVLSTFGVILHQFKEEFVEQIRHMR